jgi:D-glycero-D-manno-heptose 1,7-bisphosphate phosphatase
VSTAEEGSRALAWTASPRPQIARAVFVDRDGVINERDPSGYVVRWDAFRFRADTLRALQIVHAARLPIVVVSNQRCVALGLLSAAGLDEIMGRMTDALAAQRIDIGAWYCCPHRDEDGCDCRKPKPGMLRRAARELGIDLSRSYMIGDAEIDVAAARAAGCEPYRIDPAQPDSFERAAAAVAESAAAS